jgi:NAD(P)-dependent dehydrogenase (short-subunit alcohol dehydrogenase family)
MSTVVMTGGTSGFGAIAVGRLGGPAGHRVILGARRPDRSDDSTALDLGSLESVRAFAGSVRAQLAGAPVDALVLNAGVIRPDVTARSVDGVETTFAVNYLAHYLLTRLLLPVLAEGAVVVSTTSGTHDPTTGAGLQTPRHARAGLLAHPDRDPDRHPRPRRAGEHAYTASKLCTVLLTRSLSADPEVRSRRITPVAFCPGQVFGTGLVDDLSFPRRATWSLLGTPLGAPVRRISPLLNSRDAAARTLADLALGLAPPPTGHGYAALRRGRLTWPEPSDLARSDELARALWDDSADLVGLSP